CEELTAAPLLMIRISSASLYVAVGGDLRRRLGQPHRTKVSSGSDIANSYMPHGLFSGPLFPRISSLNTAAQASTSSVWKYRPKGFLPGTSQPSTAAVKCRRPLPFDRIR